MVDRALRSLQAALENVQSGSVFDGNPLEGRGLLADAADLRDEELGRRQVEEHGVDQVVARQLLVQDEPRRVAGEGHQRPRGGRHRLAQVVGHDGAGAAQLVLEGLDVALDGGEALRAAENRPQLALRPLEDGERLGNFGELPLSPRLAGVAPERRDFLFHVLLDATEERLGGLEVAEAHHLAPGDRQRVVDLAEQEVRGERERDAEQHADEQELPRIGEAVHEGDREREHPAFHGGRLPRLRAC